MSDSSEAIRNIFARVRQIPASERNAWLATQCPDPMVRDQVLELLSYDRDDPFLDSPIDLLGLSAEAIARKLDEEHQIVSDDSASQTLSWDGSGSNVADSTLVDRYKLLQKIGEGGFGIVYMAEQLKPVRRRVAIKLLKPGMDSKSILARFEAERQALALMDHPSIAKIFDGGLTKDGRPFFVMELVSGISLTAYCKQHRLSIRSRIALLKDVCLAIQHAHQKGIIHRDIKPSNILVQDLDGRAVPKVIDFGIAKALHGPLTDRTVFTEFRQMIGTLEYMSPEQALTSTVDVDTRSDVYALGVLAYELLTGTTPLDGATLRRLGWLEIQKTIQESESPTPSTRLASLRSEAKHEVHPHVVTSLDRQGPGLNILEQDLDWIVMKAIDKDRQRRYATALELADELQRWLQGDPILARPPSLRYRAEKWVRKHRLKALVAAVLFIALIATVGGVGYGIAERQAASKQKSESEWRAQQSKIIADLEKDRSDSLAYGNAMIAASESFFTGRRSVTQQLLDSIPESQRGPEWNWLSQMSSDRFFELQPESRGATNSLRFLPDMKTLISVGQDGMVRIWDLESRQNVRHWKASDHPLTRVEVSRQSTDVFTGDESGLVQKWDDMGRPLATRQLESSITCMTLLQNDQVLGVGTRSGEVHFLDRQSLEDRLSVTEVAARYRGRVHSLLYSPSNKQFVVAGKGGVRAVDENSHGIVAEFGNYWQSYGMVELEDKGQVAAFGPPMALLSLTTHELLREFSLPSTGVTVAVSEPKQDSLLFVTEDQALRRLNTVSGLQETLGYCDVGSVLDLARSSDGGMVALCGQDGSILVWKQSDFAMTTLLGADGPIAQLGFDSNNDLLAITSTGQVGKWRGASGELLQKQSLFEQQGFTIATSIHSNFVMAAGLPESLLVWNANNDDPPLKLPMSWGVRYAKMHPNGRWIAGPMSSDLSLYSLSPSNATATKAFDQEGQIALWDLEQRKIIRVFSGFKNWSLGLEFDREGAHLAAASVDGSVAIWDVNTGNLVSVFDGHDPIADTTHALKQVCFANESRVLFIGTGDGQVIVWDSVENRILRKIVAHGDEISRLLLVAGGQRLITASSGDSRIRVWDWRVGQKMWELDSGSPGVFDVLMGADESALYLGGSDHRIRVFRLTH